MSVFMLPEEFETPKGRKDAWRSLWVHDHGYLRKVHANEHWISDEMVRTAQPSPKDIKEWGERGLKTIINLRGLRNNPRQPGYWHLEREACREAGIEMIDLRAYSREAPKPEFIFEIDRLFREMAYPALMHCKSGADRAGIASFLYAFLRQGRSLEEAREQLSFKYGHIKQGRTGVLDHFVDTYEALAKADGVEPDREHFLNWIRTDYDREAIRDSFEPQPIGSFITETLLRRE